jgi:hypothetical protein
MQVFLLWEDEEGVLLHTEAPQFRMEGGEAVSTRRLWYGETRLEWSRHWRGWVVIVGRWKVVEQKAGCNKARQPWNACAAVKLDNPRASAGKRKGQKDPEDKARVGRREGREDWEELGGLEAGWVW